MDHFITLLVISSLLIGFCESYSKVSESLKVTLSHGGGVIGSYQTSLKGRGIRAFKGIPYAEPPVGDLRFSNPVEKSGWTGYINGVKDQVICPQIDGMISPNFAGDDDCLYLSVYAPQYPKEKGLLPVMVYIHGGAYITGSSAMFQPDYILDHDVVLVVGNYRLGPLGFMSTFTEGLRGNYGIKDQIETLKWVNKNIKAFGGDPSKVTIFGESAGGTSVSLLLSIPLTKGLFHRAIIQSGTLYEPWGVTDKGIVEKNTKNVFSFLGCTFSDSNQTEAIKCMKSKSAKEIIEHSMRLMEWDIHPISFFGPVIESMDSITPLLTQEIYDKGPDHSIPIMVGITANEGAMALSMALRTPELSKEFKENIEKILPVLAWYYHFDEDKKAERTKKIFDFYFDGKPFNWDTDQQALIDIISDSWCLQGLLKFLTKRFEIHSNNTFVYLFNYRGEISLTDVFRFGTEDVDYGVSHADDLFYLSPVSKIFVPYRAPSERDQQFRDIIIKIWVDFAISGHHAEDLKWKPANKFPVDYLRLGERDKGIGIGMKTGLFPKRSEFWQKLGD